MENKKIITYWLLLLCLVGNAGAVRVNDSEYSVEGSLPDETTLGVNFTGERGVLVLGSGCWPGIKGLKLSRCSQIRSTGESVVERFPNLEMIDLIDCTNLTSGWVSRLLAECGRLKFIEVSSWVEIDPVHSILIEAVCRERGGRAHLPSPVQSFTRFP